MTHQGIDCIPVEVEVHVSNGLPGIVIVGLPDAAVSESRDRVRSGITNSGFSFPRTRLTINLAPAHIRKSGSNFDLPIALGILQAQGIIESRSDIVAVAELALDGRTRPVSGALIYAHEAIRLGKTIILPSENKAECAILNSDKVLFAETLGEVVEYMNTVRALPHAMIKDVVDDEASDVGFSYDEIIGHALPKRALLIAAAGGHNVIISGPPGAGKTLLAKALPSILPPMTDTEIVETTKIHSIVNPGVSSVTQRPFRSPHHLASSPAILGGGAQLRPGEISLAHNGVLFLDEFPEFRRDIIEALREPLESGIIHITRAAGSVEYPARSMVIAAHNPCPCGAKQGVCVCSPQSIDRYQRKLSGPMMDRFDIKLFVQSIDPADLKQKNRSVAMGEMNTAQMKDIVLRVRMVQQQRGVLNAQATIQELEQYVHDVAATQLLDTALHNGLLSMRGYTKALRLARTIADIAESSAITTAHVAEAFRLTARAE